VNGERITDGFVPAVFSIMLRPALALPPPAARGAPFRRRRRDLRRNVVARLAVLGTQHHEQAINALPIKHARRRHRREKGFLADRGHCVRPSAIYDLAGTATTSAKLLSPGFAPP
jgi:hypothetical protein